MAKLNLRQSGRTTTMLREAEEAKRDGHSVIIVAPSHYVRDQIVMLARSKRMLSTDGGVLDRCYDFVTTTEILTGRKRGVDAQVFCDHTVQELMTVETLLRLSVEIQMISRSFLQPEAQEAAERWSFTSF